MGQQLPSAWTLWAHLPHDTDWTLDSYRQITTFALLEDCIKITEWLPQKFVTNCMLFIMREGVSPTWEDDKNRDGGSFSYKLQNRLVPEAWKELTYRLVGETLLESTKQARKVNGITISPKKNFCIVKVWMGACDITDPSSIAQDSSTFKPKCCIFKRHKPVGGP